MLQRLLGISTTRPLRWRKAALGHSWHRFMRHQAFDDAFDAEELLEARRWHQSFQPSSIPKGQTVFSRSSGPGGQHVNKTETKAITSWPVAQLMSILPKMLRSGLRASKYYAERNDSISLSAQTSRSRTANAEENHQKLFDEIQRLYKERVPSETGAEKRQKYAQLKKSSTEARLKAKKVQSSKKSTRRTGGQE